MKSDKKVSTVKTTVSTIELNRQDIVNFLLQNGYFQKGVDFESMDIFVKVPGGGDYSNCTLDIDDCPINIVIKQVEEN